MIWLAIFLGGGFGSVLRFASTTGTNNLFKTNFPLGTLVSNILACLILGWLIFLAKDQIKPNSFWFYFTAVGICGGFSTFSTFSMETIQLAQNGAWLWVALNILTSLSICFAILWCFAKA